jgi:hypothetical protein
VTNAADAAPRQRAQAVNYPASALVTSPTVRHGVLSLVREWLGVH